MYFCQWHWKNEYKAFLVQEESYDFATKKARSLVGNGGTLQIERVVWGADSPDYYISGRKTLTTIAMLISK
jgi:hypothetical protein